MKSPNSILFPATLFGTALLAGQIAAAPEGKPAGNALPLPAETSEVAGHEAFLMMPENSGKETPWVWYAPTLPGLPSESEKWMFEEFLKAGIAIAGIDVGESYGSPEGRRIYDAFYAHLTGERDLSPTPLLLARSRGGLMLLNWAIENPESVGGIAGIYPASNLASYPGLERAAPAYGMSAGELKTKLAEINPVDRLDPLAKAGVPVLLFHGDNDKVVPLEDNSGLFESRYKSLGGPVELEVIQGQGHNLWQGWFQSRKLRDFVVEKAGGKAIEGNDPLIKEGAKLKLRGRLEGGLSAIGGGTKGWILTYPTRKGNATIEVDLGAIEDAGNLNGTEVSVTGRIVSKNHLERGPSLILIAKSLEPTQQAHALDRKELKLPGLRVDLQNRLLDVDAVVCLGEGLLELVACTKDSKEHESIVAIEAKPMHIHAALLLLGANAGNPAMQKRREDDPERWVYLPPRGGKVDVSLVFANRQGKPTEHPIREFISPADDADGGFPSPNGERDEAAGRFPTSTFLFAGSLIAGEKQGARHYLCDESGNVISLSTFGDELLCLPEVHSQDNGALMWQIDSTELPAVGTKVILRLRPHPAPDPTEGGRR